MIIRPTSLPGVVVLEPRLHGDARGYFFESFSARVFERQVLRTRFVQDNESASTYGVVRGLHYQRAPHSQGKLVRVVHGRVLDVAVDLRRGSPTYGQHVALELSSTNHRQLFIPRGFAHGYSVLSPEAVLLYKCDAYYAPQSEGGIAWDDPALGIDWQVPRECVILSPKDTTRPRLAEAPPDFHYTTPLYSA